MDKETRCPNCGTTKYANVNLRMMVNVCGHSLCESCVELLFVKGAAKCPTCQVLLKRVQFRIQLYDDETVEKDLEIRRRLIKDLSLKEDDFETLREYNDYLELFETFVYNLANDIDVTETNRLIEQFKSDNAAKLAKSRNKISKDMELIQQLLEEELMEQGNRSMMSVDNDDDMNLAAKKVAQYKENLLDALVHSDMPAEIILRTHQKQAENELAAIDEMEQKRQQDALRMKRQQMNKQKIITSTGVRLGQNAKIIFDKEYNEIQGERFVYTPIKMPNAGPQCPTPGTIERKQYMQHVRMAGPSELAAGFFPIYPCQRALQEAIMDLTFIPRTMESN